MQVADLSFTSDTVSYPAKIAGAGTIDLYRRNTILDIIRVCLYHTGLELDTYFYANIYDTDQITTDNFLAQTYLDTQTFIKGDTFDNCYDVLTSIFERFHLSLFQSEGAWRIIRWDEARYYNGAIPYFRYDSDFNLLSTGTLGATFTTGHLQPIYPGTPLISSITRPFKHTKATFEYQQPKYLLKNYDLQDLGGLIRTYPSGSDTYEEYEFTDWYDGGYFPQPEYFIRVVMDTVTADEKARYLVIKGETGDFARAIVSTPFEVSAGDRLVFEFNYRTTKSQSGSPSAVMVLALMHYDGTTFNYADENPTVKWKPTLGWQMPVPGNTMDGQTAIFDTQTVPGDGLIYCYLPQACAFSSAAVTNDETHITDIRVRYIPTINDSVKIIGQIHTAEQFQNIKNNEDGPIYLDDSPRNSIIGTLFKASFGALIQDRTFQWYRLSNPSELLTLGNITTQEQEQWRLIPRTKLEGTLYGVAGLSLLAILTNNGFPGVNFVFGSLEIKYRNNNFACTMWEVCNDEDLGEDFAADYNFRYLYDNK